MGGAASMRVAYKWQAALVVALGPTLNEQGY
jgi:hypothetical protein